MSKNKPVYKNVYAFKVDLQTHKTIDIIAKLKNFVTISETQNYIKELFGKSEYEKIIVNAPFPKDFKSLGNGVFVPYSSIEREIFWNACILSRYKTELNEFISYEKKYSQEFVNGNYEKAQELLNVIEVKFGASFWLIENRFSLYQEMEGHEKQKAYARALQTEEGASPLVKWMVYFLSVRAEKNISFDRYQEMLMRSIRDNNCEEGLTQFLLFKMNFYGRYRVSDYLSALVWSSDFSIIDRYLALIKVLQLMFARNEKVLSGESVSKSVSILYKSLADERMADIAFFLGLESEVAISSETIKAFEVLDLYTKGKYEKVIEICEGLIEENALPDIYETYIKAKVRQGDFVLFDDSNIKKRILGSMQEVVLKTNKAQEGLSELKKIISVNAAHYWSALFLAFLYREYYHSKAELELFKFSELNVSIQTPRRLILTDEETKEIYTGVLKENFFNSPTLLLYEYLDGDADDNNLSGVVASDRHALYKAERLFNQNQFESAVEIYNSLLKSKDGLIYQTAIIGISKAYAKLDKLNECIDIMVDAFLGNPNLCPALPIQEILNITEKRGRVDIYKNISLSILYHAFSQYISREKEEMKTRAVEEFLEMNKLKKPSEIRGRINEFRKDKLIYFLKNLCIQSVLDGSIAFEGTEDVETERIAICQLLMSLDSNNQTVLTDEIKRITQFLVVNKGIQQIEESKIDVDVEGIKSVIEKNMRESYVRYQAFLADPANDQNDNMDIIFDFISKLAGEKKLTITIPGNEMDLLFNSMVKEIRDKFVSSNAHGLDGHLSVGIRHGTLSGELRRSLILHNLVTQKDEKGKYRNNEYWEKEYLRSAKPNLKNLFLIMNNFTEKIDKLIDSLSAKWIQIKSENKSEGMFLIEFDSVELKKLQKNITTKTSYEQFLELVFNSLWTKTENSLDSIRNKIIHETKNDFMAAFETLQSGLKDKGVIIPDLETNIIQARSEIQNTLDKIANWFKRSKSSETANFNLKLAIDICSQMISNLFPYKKFNLRVENKSEVLFSGRCLKSFVNLIFILFENVIKHGGDESPYVIINAQDPAKGETVISCKNSLSASSDLNALRKNIKDLMAKLEKQENLENVSREGGTGFFKISKIITVDLRSELKIRIDVESDFHVQIAIHTDRITV